MKKIFITFLFFFIFFSQAIFAQTEYSVALREIISNFDSVIEVRKDSTVAVTETIKVFASNKKIQHGIFRDFPTKYKDASGYEHSVRFEVVSVKLDGELVQYKILGFSNGKRVRIGNPNEYVSIGWHSYEISYVTDNQLGFFDDHDELYWNVTGNGWEFPIEKATARVVFSTSVFPPSSSSFDGYTGKFGSKEKHYTARLLDSSTLYYETTQALAPQEGLTIVVGWPKGYVTPPSKITLAAQWFFDNLWIFIVSIIFLAALWYYLYVWNTFGRDPKKGAIIPQYEPPLGFSPASLNYVRSYGANSYTNIAASILDLAVNGYIKIEEDKSFFKKFYHLKKIDNPKVQLNEEQAKFYDLLFSGGSEIEIGKKYNPQFAKILLEMTKYYKEKLGGYFTYNLRYWLPGEIIMSIAQIYILMFGPDSNILRFGILGILVAVPVIFLALLRRPSVEGRKLMDEIEGFKWFLEVTEKDRMNFHNPPEKTPELFEKYLAYALALGVEHKWSEQFAGIFENLEREGRPYQPLWYSGAAFHAATIASFGGDFGKSLNHAVSASLTRPGSSSGFGGGGSSGGGGGGGGGGGW